MTILSDILSLTRMPQILEKTVFLFRGKKSCKLHIISKTGKYVQYRTNVLWIRFSTQLGIYNVSQALKSILAHASHLHTPDVCSMWHRALRHLANQSCLSEHSCLPQKVRWPRKWPMHSSVVKHHRPESSRALKTQTTSVFLSRTGKSLQQKASRDLWSFTATNSLWL